MRPRSTLRAITLLLAAVVLVASSGCASEPEKVSAFPEIQLITQSIDGEIVDVGPVLHQDSLLWFWAPW